VAVALQRRVLMLMGYAAHEPGFPYQHREWAVTAGDELPVTAIRVEAVLEATAKALAQLGAVNLPSPS